MTQFSETVLTVGIRDKTRAIKNLPLRILVLDRGIEAITHLFKDKIDIVISHWDVVDMPNGKLLKEIIAAQPNIPTIAFVKAGDEQQETLARTIGATVVLADNIDDEYFCRILRQVFDLDNASLRKDHSSMFQNEMCC